MPIKHVDHRYFQAISSTSVYFFNRLVHTSGISNDDQYAFFGIKENLERILNMQKKQKDMRDYF